MIIDHNDRVQKNDPFPRGTVADLNPGIAWVSVFSSLGSAAELLQAVDRLGISVRLIVLKGDPRYNFIVCLRSLLTAAYKSLG